MVNENIAITEVIPGIEKMPKRENSCCVISKEAYGEHAVHDIQTNSAWTSNPYGEAYSVVPDDLVPEILATFSFSIVFPRSFCCSAATLIFSYFLFSLQS